MQKCTSKREIRCFYLTKDNYEEFLREVYPEYKNDYIRVNIEDESVVIESYDMVHVSRRYDFGWWVGEINGCDYPQWWHYTDDEFKEKYMIIS